MKACLLIILLLLCTSFHPPQAQDSAAARERVMLPAYSDSANGLKKLIRDIFAARKSGNERLLAAYYESLVLPDPDSWFREVFGEEQGPQLAEFYRQRRERLPSSLALAISEMLAEKRETLEVFRFVESCDKDADSREYPVLALRVQDVPLYDVRFARDGTAKSLWFFAHVQGTFRYVGDAMPPLYPGGVVMRARDARGVQLQRQRISIGKEVQAAKIISQPRPQYPEKARRGRLTGTVEMRAIISEDGAVENLRVMRGHCWLAEAAMEAVRKWRYQPTLVDGKPVSVVTTIDVVFALQ